jgi:hypothetical protein
MLQVNQMTKRMIITIALTAGFLFIGAGQTTAQEDCKSIVNPTSARDCWVKKAKSGEKNLSGADFRNADLRGVLLKAILTGAKIDSTTKGVTFEDWKNLGGIVVE